MESGRIRERFLSFFAERGHTIVRSSSLVPASDPTLLFANAGMNQFKAVFLGLERRDYVRAASVQKCMRVSGKHNDLEEVGRDARHHTFFEMLGNWSFGDYGKRESILWGWEFLTREMGLEPERLWASVYKDDDEAYGVWRDEVRLPEARILRLGDLARGDEENFWSMAETGPCGPCSEIHYDQGPELSCDHPDGCALGVCDCDRWLELWNHVFMEFDRDEAGNLRPLPMKSVDTGLGFERLVAVMQGVPSDYDSDLFMPLIQLVASLCGHRPEGSARISMQVIADHARACAFTIADGALPANEGRGYVVRRILRRAARHGRLLDLHEPFLWRIAGEVIARFGAVYPELVEQEERVLRTIRGEEERFNRTLDSGLQIYAEIRQRLRSEGGRVISGEDAFRLHDTYGFPLDLTVLMASEDGLKVDEASFAERMAAQRAASTGERTYREGIGRWQSLAPDAGDARARFVGYEHLSVITRPLAMRTAGSDAAGDPLCHLLCAETPFYAEAGGQVGDRGTLHLLPDGPALPVLDTVASENGPACVVPGTLEDLLERLRRCQAVRLEVDPAERLPTMRHHTATHLLHAALRRVLGEHVEQAGSEVTPQKLRFDFRHDAPLTAEQLLRVEEIVNAQILANRPVMVHQDVPLAEARARGAMALFGEKYAERVRMIEIPGDEGTGRAAATAVGPGGTAGSAPFSLELCGGTHVGRTGDIGPFRVVAESGSAAGVRRIEAVAGEPALALARREREELAALDRLLHSDGRTRTARVRDLIREREALRRELQDRQREEGRGALADSLASAVSVAGVRVVATRVPAADREGLLQLADDVRDRLGSGVAVLGAEWGGKATLLVTLTPDLVEQKRLHAGELIKELAGRVGGRGGGRPHLAQAGLPVEVLDRALALALDVVREKLEATAG